MSHKTPATIDARRTAKRTTGAVGLLVGSLVVGLILAIGGFLTLEIADATTAGSEAIVGFLASELGYLLVALAFLRWWADDSFLSLRRPTLEELRLAGIGVAVVIALEGTRQLAVTLDLLARAGTVPVDGEISVAATLGMVLLMVLLAPPVEELLFRGVIQRYVSAVSSSVVGIGVATVLFVPMHAIGILGSTDSVPAVLAVVSVLAVLSVVLGYVYDRTGNLVVPIVVHAAYNALAILLGVLFLTAL